MAEKSKIKREILLAFDYIKTGCVKLYDTDEIDASRSKIKILGYDFIQKGANILSAVSHLSNFDGARFDDKFPTDMRTVLELVKDNTIDEWVEKYAFLEEYVTEFSENYYSFLDDVEIGEHNGSLTENSEYELFVKYNNDKAFEETRRLAMNDYQYAFSRVGIPTLLDGNLINIKTQLKEDYKKKFGEEDISDKFIEHLVLNYYKDTVNLNKYYHTKEGYAYCKKCGSLLQQTSRQNQISCSFDLCNSKHKKFNKKVEIGGFIKNPTKMLRYEVLRFVSYPSIEEWSMYTRLKEYDKKGIISDLILYYNKDACDISFVYKGKRIAIDLKEWVRAEDLAIRISEENFKRNNRDADCYIVIPDYLTKKSTGRSNAYIKMLRDRVDESSIKKEEIVTVDEFMKKLKAD